jgi:hypothetical protein
VRDVASGAGADLDRTGRRRTATATGRAGGLGLLARHCRRRTVVLRHLRRVRAAPAGARGRRRGRGRRTKLTLGRPRVAACARRSGAPRAHGRGAAGLLLPRGSPAHRRDAAGLADGVLHGWLRTLESTLPAHPDLTLVAFVPALVLLAAVVGAEWLRRGVAAG